MKLEEIHIKGVYEITLCPKNDLRGFFMRTYDILEFRKERLNEEWIQENHSMTKLKDTIRGLHFQFPPFAETKLIRCTKGEVLNVFLDLRKNSPTFGEWSSILLNEKNKKMVYIPKGFANGFAILKNNSEVIYKTDNIYNSEYEGNILWNDKDLNIEWNVKNPLLSERDKNNMTFNEFVNRYKYLEL